MNEVHVMSEERVFGVECKNEKCGVGIALGTYLTNPKVRGDIVTFVVVKTAGTVKCPSCDKEAKYDQEDLREL
jgi:hypothetical protein